MLYRLIIILALSTTANADFDCSDQIKEYEKCGASFQFNELYGILCKEASELMDVDIISSYKFIDEELGENPCLARVYVAPRQYRKKRARYWRERINDERKEKRKARSQRDKEKSSEESR